ncbi:hypothetical protein AB6A40_010133 [Gnathostoma spinigerum]|uniref:Uncharacterized protein n=1 Tax=Gnathostoma spinigerum TaxID=75299 RepID=A0ABD6EZ29_9BILA
MSGILPTGAEWISAIDTVHLVITICSTIFTLLVSIAAVTHLICVHYYVSNEYVQTDLYYLSLLLPVMSICSLLGMYFPRNTQFLYAVALTSVCFFFYPTIPQSMFSNIS